MRAASRRCTAASDSGPRQRSRHALLARDSDQDRNEAMIACHGGRASRTVDARMRRFTSAAVASSDLRGKAETLGGISSSSPCGPGKERHAGVTSSGRLAWIASPITSMARRSRRSSPRTSKSMVERGWITASDCAAAAPEAVQIRERAAMNSGPRARSASAPYRNGSGRALMAGGDQVFDDRDHPAGHPVTKYRMANSSFPWGSVYSGVILVK